MIDENEDTIKVDFEESISSELDELKTRYAYLAADFDNYRKRMKRERAELINSASKDILTDILPIIDDFERVLRYVGFKCLKSQKIEFDKDSLLYIIDEAKDFCPDLHFTSSDFLNDILSSVPLFCKDGQYLKWVHKSLQEYFAAQFIYKDSKESQDAILSALYNSDNLDKYMNIYII